MNHVWRQRLLTSLPSVSLASIWLMWSERGSGKRIIKRMKKAESKYWQNASPSLAQSTALVLCNRLGWQLLSQSTSLREPFLDAPNSTRPNEQYYWESHKDRLLHTLFLIKIASNNGGSPKVSDPGAHSSHALTLGCLFQSFVGFATRGQECPTSALCNSCLINI